MKTFNLAHLMQQQHDKPRYLKISAVLRIAIKRRLLEPGEQLPAARALAQELSSNRHTIMAAYQELIAEGWIISQQRKGYFVADILPIEQSEPGTSDSNKKRVQPQSFDWQFTHQLSEPFHDCAADYKFNFAGGTPDIAQFPFKEFKGFVNDALTRPDLASLNYGGNAGFKPLIKQISLYLRRARSLIGREIVITNGSQEALYILSQLLLNKDVQVAAEAMGYAPAWNAFRSSGTDIMPVAQDDLGIIPASFEQAITTAQAQQRPIKLLYLTPLHQYPTTVTLPIARRHAIYRLAQQHNIAIIEDDYDHEFHYRCQPLAPMASDDPYGLVIYLSTFSKIMFPGARIGFMALDKPLADAVVSYKTIMNQKVSVTMQDAIARWMQAGNFERYLRKITKLYQQRRDFMIEQLTHYAEQGHVVSFTTPDGGMAVWVELSYSARDLCLRASAQDIFVQHQQRFMLEPAQNSDRFIRLGFAGMSCEKIKTGLQCLFAQINR